MQVTLELPDALAEQLTSGGRDLARAVFESLVVEQYREGEISRGKLAEMLGLSIWQSEEFLRKRDARLPFSNADLEADRAASDQLTR